MKTDEKRLFALESMGFKEDPFKITTDPRFLYIGPQHQEIMRRIRTVVENYRGLAVVEGDYGTGKTTLLKRVDSLYRNDYPDDAYVIYTDSSHYSSEYSALMDICNIIGLDKKRGITAQYRELQSFITEQSKAGKTIILFMDDAQKMDVSVLNLIHELYNFEYNQKSVQTILFGQPEISNIFARKPEVRSRVFSWFQLNPLTMSETYELVHFRCKVAGRDAQFIKENNFIKVFEATRGVPRYTVSLCAHIIDLIMETGNIGLATVDEAVIEQAIARFQAGENRGKE
jgi:general secretion pathway protein A